uniref:Predicted protein n=1 Tax=Physcomitrium patens TaxID=3218 RepID=A9U3G2_PHYPA
MINPSSQYECGVTQQGPYITPNLIKASSLESSPLALRLRSAYLRTCSASTLLLGSELGNQSAARGEQRAKKYIPLEKLPRALAENLVNRPGFLLRPLTESGGITKELGTPLGTFPIAETADFVKTGSIEWHKLLVNKGQFSVFQNPSFSPPIQPINLFKDNNSKLSRVESSENIFGRDADYINKRLSVTLSNSMTMGGPAVPIAVKMGTMIETVAHSSVNTQGRVNVTPLQALPPQVITAYAPYFPYQIQESTLAKKQIIPASKDSNEALLLNLTKKMEEMAVNMAKDMEKRQKPTNTRTNVWCSNCEGHGDLVTECPSPSQVLGKCTFCGGKHLTANCWNLQRQQQFSNPTMIPPTPWDVNQIQSLGKMKGINRGPQDSPVNRVECIHTVLTRTQQKEKGPIKHLEDPKAKGQSHPITDPSHSGPDTGKDLSPHLVAKPNEAPITESSVPSRADLFPPQFQEASYLLKDLLGKGSIKEAQAAVPIPSPGR